MSLDFLSLPEREDKPRSRGRTHILDKGASLAELRGLLPSCHRFIDLAKLGWGTAVVTEDLEAKLALYRSFDIEVCLGGSLFELAVLQGAVEDYRAWLKDIGLRVVEISDGIIELAASQKLAWIERFARDFSVYSEVGSKDAATVAAPMKWVRAIKDELSAGARAVILEGRESGTAGLYRGSGEIRAGLVEEILASGIARESVVFEAPRRSQQAWLVRDLGPEVNLGNIALGEALPLETLRLGLRGDTMRCLHGQGQRREEPRLLVLGGGRHQKVLIQRAEGRGVRTVIADYYPDAPGKAFASYPTMVDAMDIEANVALAREYGVRGLVTVGTDQPVNTMAAVSRRLGLPCYLSPESARLATRKDAMRAAFARAGLINPPYAVVEDPEDGSAAALGFPLVVKPTDSQGQRGTRRVESSADLAPALRHALASSRSGLAIAEAFLPGFEVTINAWVSGGEARVLMVTDRVTFNPAPALGICFQHIFPSLRAAGRGDEVRAVAAGVQRAYGIEDGPLYIQAIVGAESMVVIEASCRVGGGHEASLIPRLTGVSILDRVIDLALGQRPAPLEFEYDEDAVPEHALVQFLLAERGVIAERGDFASLIAGGQIEEGEYYYALGHECRPIENSLGRVGYFVAVDRDRAALLARARRAYEACSLTDARGQELLFWPDAERLLG